MTNKGVSAIIATILLLLIAIGLSGTAYIYFSGMVSGRTQKAISISDAHCNGTHVTMVVSNDGTVDIADSDITVLIDNEDVSGDFAFGTISPHDVSTVTSTGSGLSSEQHTLLVVSPANTVRQVVYC